MATIREQLRPQINTARAEVARLRRLLPKPGPGQSHGDASCAYWLERAVQSLARAEEAWDEAEGV